MWPNGFRRRSRGAESTSRTAGQFVFLTAVVVAGCALAVAAVGTATAQTTTAPDCSTVGYEGSGTDADPYQVGSVSQLQCMGNENTTTNQSDVFVQVTDIDASGTAEWNGGDGFEPVTVAGAFDGNGYNITGLTIDRPNTDSVGLFDRAFGTVENVSLVRASVSGTDLVGALVGFNRATIRNVSVEAEVFGRNFVGGLAGQNGGSVYTGRIERSRSLGSVEAAGSRAGGLVGENFDGTINRSYSTSRVEMPAGEDAGGLVGFHDTGSVSNSYALGAVTGDKNVAGLVGFSRAKISGSYAAGNVTGAGESGGLVAFSSDTVVDSYWDTNRTTQNSSQGGTALETRQMRGEDAKTNMTAFDFASVWRVPDGGPYPSYPVLRSTPQREPSFTSELPGDGTRYNPYGIFDWYDLDDVRRILSRNFELRETLDTSTAGYGDVAGETANGGRGFEPLGNSTSAFRGGFDGAGNEIAGLFVDRPSTRGVGLFGFAGSTTVDGVLGEARIESLALRGIDITGDSSVGGLAGRLSNGSVVDSSVRGNVTGDDQVGGLVGGIGNLLADARGSVKNGSAVTTVNGSTRVGGLVGNNDFGLVTDSSARAAVSGTEDVGGLLGVNSRDVSDVSVRGAVTAEKNVGGLVGRNGGGFLANGRLTDGSADVLVNGSGSSTAVGGFVGRNTAEIRYGSASGFVTGEQRVGGFAGLHSQADSSTTIEESYATAAVNGSDDVGGFVGTADGNLTDAYATGAVAGETNVGGFVGRFEQEAAPEQPEIRHAYAVGTTEGKSPGGFVGNRSNATVTEAYWNTDSTTLSTSDGGVGLETAEMLGDPARTNMSGFDFADIWTVLSESNGEGPSYPFLRRNSQDPAPGSIGADIEFNDTDVFDGTVSVDLSGLAGVQDVALEVLNADERFEQIAALTGSDRLGAGNDQAVDIGSNPPDAGDRLVVVAYEDDGLEREVDRDNAAVTNAQPATPSLSNLSIASQGTTATVVEGTNESVTADVENVGDEDGSFTVTLTITNATDGTTVVTTSNSTQALASNETAVLTFENATDGLTAGTYGVAVSAENTTVAGNLTVQTPANFTVGIGATNAPVLEGGMLSVNATVENVGEAGASKNLTLAVGSLGTTATTVSLAGGQSKAKRLTVDTELDDAGTYTATVSTPDDVTATQVTVEPRQVVNLSTLDIAGQGAVTVVAGGAGENVTVAVESILTETRTTELVLRIVAGSDPVAVTSRNVTLGAGATTTVTFENVTETVPVAAETYTVSVSARVNETNGSLNVHPDVNGNGEPARDTTGNGLLNDVSGSDGFGIADVVALFEQFRTSVVADYPSLFRFNNPGAKKPDSVGIADVVALFDDV